MQRAFPLLVSLVLAAVAVAPARAQSLREQINSAIDRGVENLLDTQELDGSWYQHRPRYRAGQTALCLYALLECDVDPEHASVQRALAFLDAAEPYYTYEVSVTVIAYLELLDRLGGSNEEVHEDLTEKVERYVELLVEYQADNGGWAYPDRVVDMSNAQYAGMALRNAALAGFDVPRGLWKDLARYVMSVQERTVRGSNPMAGVKYTEEGEPRGSMTAAGVATLYLCREQYGRAPSKWIQHQDAALRWLEEHIVMNDNPGLPGGWVYYYLYNVERVGAYLGIDTIGDLPWYETGAAWLVGEQRENGSWWNATDTSYALLFLKRATAPSTGGGEEGPQLSFGEDDPAAMVSVRAFGENPMRIWLSSFGEAELEEFGVENDLGQRSLEVLSCEYWIDEGPRIDEPVMFGSLEGDHAASRYMLEHEFPRRGRYTVRAVVRIQSPHEGDGVIELESEPLEIRARRGDQTRLLEIARSLSRNMLLDVEFEARSGSRLNDDSGPRLVADGTLSSGWVSDTRDPKPWVHLTWKEYLKVGSLRIAHLSTGQAPESVLPKRLEITLNGRKEFFVDMPNDREQFGHLVFEKVEKIRGIRIKVVELHEDPEGRIGPVGFGEVALHPSDD